MPLVAPNQGSGGSLPLPAAIPGHIAPPGGNPPGAPPPGPGTPNIIPDAGVYGAETAAALNAYNNAVAQATAQRNALYNQYGLTSSGQVDPNNPEGAYQQMLRAQADQYSADQQDAAGRNLRGGLAHQQEGHDRQGALAQDFQFQQQVASAGTDYQDALANALSTRQSADSQAYNDAMNTALQNMLAQMQAGQYDQPAPAQTPAPKPPAKAPAKAKAPVKKPVSHHTNRGRGM